MMLIAILGAITLFISMPRAASAQQREDQIQRLIQSGVITRQQLREMEEGLEGEQTCFEALERIRQVIGSAVRRWSGCRGKGAA
jgi:hypothetical protein